MSEITRAISIRQPYVELILQGQKTEEYRSRRTHLRGEVYIYASLKPAEDAEEWIAVGKRKGELPVGVIVGTVEITGCYWLEEYECYAYELKNPKRLASFLKPTNQPQPCFWLPQF